MAEPRPADLVGGEPLKRHIRLAPRAGAGSSNLASSSSSLCGHVRQHGHE